MSVGFTDFKMFVLHWWSKSSAYFRTKATISVSADVNAVSAKVGTEATDVSVGTDELDVTKKTRQ